MGWSYTLLTEPAPCACCGAEAEDGYLNPDTGELLCPDCWDEEEKDAEQA